MSYHEQAEGINKDLKQLFESIPINQFSTRQRADILNIMIRIGQVAKFRCRSNTAYDNFINCCFKGIATTSRVKINETDDFEILKANIKEEGDENGYSNN